MTASVPPDHTTACNIKPPGLSSFQNNITRCAVKPCKNVCQVIGRIILYLLEQVEARDYTITYANLTATGLLFYSYSTEGSQVLTATYKSLRTMSTWVGNDAAIVYLTRSSMFRITVAGAFESDKANKHTCVLITRDGSMRVQGSLQDIPRVCSRLCDAIIRISESTAWAAFVPSLAVTKERYRTVF